MEIADRLYHRQMYIDLVSVYLRGYGSQRALAQALGVTEGAISQLLTPAHPPWEGTHSVYWADTLLDPPDAVDSVSVFKTPTRQRAEQIAAELCTDAERRDRLLYHTEHARAPAIASDGVPIYVDDDEVREWIGRLGAEFETALLTGDPEQARSGYARVWDASNALIERIHPVRLVLERVQVLLFLHDAACVLDRADLGLGYARQAIVLLAAAAPGQRGRLRDRFLVNALLAEVVALNNLGLARSAYEVAQRARSLPGYLEEPHYWRRSFLEQEIKSLSRLPGDHLYDAEARAEQAQGLAPTSHGISAGIEAYMIQAYLARGTGRSLRKAGRHIAALQAAAIAADTSVLRKLRILRTVAAYAQVLKNGDLLRATVRRAFQLSEIAGLLHQRAMLARSYRRYVDPICTGD